MRFGLYYPFIHFKDDDWLKLSALYWDKMGRIVPNDYETVRDTDTVKALRDELGFVRNYDPMPVAFNVSERFAEVLIQNEGALTARYNVWDSEHWAVVPHTVAFAPEGSERLAHVYAAKISPNLRDDLIATNLAVPVRRDDRWLGMHQALVETYMAALASELATSGIPGTGPLVPTTDETLNHVAGSGWSVDRIAAALLGDAERQEEIPEDQRTRLDWLPGEETAENAMAFMAIKSVVPTNLAAVPVDKIIEVREQFGDELGNFQNHLADATDNVGAIGEAASPEIAKDQLTTLYKETIEQPMDDLRKGLKSFHIDTTFSALDISFALPSVIGALTLNPILAAGGAVAYSATKFIRDQRRAGREIMADSPAAYLLRIEEELQPQTLVGWIRQRVSSFLRGD